MLRKLHMLMGVVGAISILSLALIIYSVLQIVSEKRERERLVSNLELARKPATAEEDLALENLVIGALALHHHHDSDDSHFNSTHMAEAEEEFNVIGKMSIPRIKKKWAIIEGTGNRQLAKGIGHYKGSALPGEVGNVVLAGHRESGLMKLGQVKAGDKIQIETAAGDYIYEITETKIVKKDDQTIPIFSDTPTLTLVTCYPLQYFGPSPERYIVTAELVVKELSN